LILRHLNKAAAGSAIYRGSGSIGITGAARVVLLAAKDPDQPSACVLAPIKSNLGPPAKALRYGIGERDGAAVVLWGGECDHTAETLLLARDPRDAPERDEAVDFLRGALAKGSRAQSELLSEAKEAGIAEKTLRRAKRTLQVESFRRGYGAHGVWEWRLPAESQVATFGAGTIDGQPPRPSMEGSKSEDASLSRGQVAIFEDSVSANLSNPRKEEEKESSPKVSPLRSGTTQISGITGDQGTARWFRGSSPPEPTAHEGAQGQSARVARRGPGSVLPGEGGFSCGGSVIASKGR